MKQHSTLKERENLFEQRNFCISENIAENNKDQEVVEKNDPLNNMTHKEKKLRNFWYHRQDLWKECQNFNSCFMFTQILTYQIMAGKNETKMQAVFSYKYNGSFYEFVIRLNPYFYEIFFPYTFKYIFQFLLL